MLKFWIIYVIVCFMSYNFITAKVTHELKRMQIEERWSEARILINAILLPLFNILGVILLIILIIPMTLDLPGAITGNQTIYKGLVNSVECSIFCQNQKVHVDNDNDEEIKLKLYFHKKLKQNEIYEIKYLPKSKFTIKVSKPNN